MKNKRTGSRYAGLKHRRLRKALNHIEQYENDIMDLRPEVQMLRALVVMYIEDYDEFTAALMAWYADEEGSSTKPRRIPDIQDVGTMLEKITKMVQRIHTIEQTGSITLSTFHRVMEAMGVIVAAHVSSDIVLDLIEADWKDLPLDVTRIDDRYDQQDVEQEDARALVKASSR